MKTKFSYVNEYITVTLVRVVSRILFCKINDFLLIGYNCAFYIQSNYLAKNIDLREGEYRGFSGDSFSASRASDGEFRDRKHYGDLSLMHHSTMCILRKLHHLVLGLRYLDS